ncbi:Hypothetical predicted protein [Pelobates cultripes]|uniref:Uncharacterized protein n=1 Tax=Pelobates cultripes TaxID=61616 RepID=A0AAD1QZN1_PELCU|nr:Hypothetical predicted protein [Pelobates cultripes]
MLREIFKVLVGRGLDTPTEFVQAHKAFRPRRAPDCPPWDMICCMANFRHKEGIQATRNSPQLIYKANTGLLVDTQATNQDSSHSDNLLLVKNTYRTDGIHTRWPADTTLTQGLCGLGRGSTATTS